MRFPTCPKAACRACAPTWCGRKPWPRSPSNLRLGESLRLGEGELKSGGFRRPSILADALESLFGAVFLEAGFDEAQRVVRGLFDPLVAQIDPKASGKDPKTQLQEMLQSRRLPLPDYRLVDTEGEAHDQSFIVECVLGKPALSTRGVGKSRRAAEQEAARQACAALRNELQHRANSK